MPSAAVIEANGQDLGDIQATLLKKVEELTLYVIELEDGRQKLEVENKELKTMFLELKKEIEQLKKDR